MPRCQFWYSLIHLFEVTRRLLDGQTSVLNGATTKDQSLSYRTPAPYARSGTVCAIDEKRVQSTHDRRSARQSMKQPQRQRMTRFVHQPVMNGRAFQLKRGLAIDARTVDCR